MTNERTGFDKKGLEYEAIDCLPFQKKYVGVQFNQLIAITPVKILNKIVKYNNTDAWWLFKCNYGQYICHRMGSIRLGKIIDCGCSAQKKQDAQYIGKEFNYLTIIERDNEFKETNNIKSSNQYYKCRCRCGNYKTVRINALTSGEVKSCGCLKKEQEKINLVRGYNFQDLTGKRFGQLVVLKRSKNKIDKDILWTCKCDCGTIKDIRGVSLRGGHVFSCGCLSMSRGEYKIKEILISQHIPFVFNQVYFKDLLLPSGGTGRYDFIILDNNNSPIRIIEYDGEQHFKPVEYFGGQQKFIIRQEDDKIKNEYALSHNIPLVRIPYSEFNNISLDLLMGDKYLIRSK